MSVDDLPPVLAEAIERLGTLRTSQIAGALRMRGGVLADNVASWDSGPVVYAACLAARSGQRLHMMAVDDGDARRRAEAVEGMLDLLGLSVRVLGPALPGEGGTGLDGSVPTSETRGGTYAADVVVGTPERFALDYLVDKMASSPEDLVGHEFGWVFLPEADYFLLDQAFERVWVDGEGSTLSRIRIHEYLRLYDTACGVTPIQMSDTDREEIQRLYGFEVVRSDRLMTRVELPDVTHPYHDGRLVAVARSAVELRNRGRRVVVGVSNPDHVGDLISALRRESAETVVVATPRSPSFAPGPRHRLTGCGKAFVPGRLAISSRWSSTSPVLEPRERKIRRRPCPLVAERNIPFIHGALRPPWSVSRT